MCGIVGAVGHVTPSLIALVERMNGAQVHRGPDDDGLYHTESGRPGVVFGFRRLAIIDTSSAGHQPMQDPETGTAMVFNGEIYNHRTLRSELSDAAPVFRGQSDSETLLACYRRWGTHTAPRLRGMFAAAFWEPSQNRCTLIRDRLGIKPLYYWRGQFEGQQVVLFASEVRSLLSSGAIPRKLHRPGLEGYLWNGFMGTHHTAVADVHPLPAGSIGTISAGDTSISIESYWRLPAPSQSEKRASLSSLSDTLRESAALHLAADVPVGVFLSGGVDSSAVTALATQTSPHPVHTFNIGFSEASYDESAYARAVAKALGTQHTGIQLGETDFAGALSDAFAAQDQPTFDAINSYLVSRAVREAGIVVALAGTGGDELFGGYRSFRALPRMAQALRRTPRALQASIARLDDRILGPAHRAFGGFPAQTGKGKWADVLRTQGDLLSLYQVAYGLFTSSFHRRLLHPDHRPSTDHGLGPDEAYILREGLQGRSPLSAIAYLELQRFIGARLLPDTDAASMAVSLEARVPLLDHVVVECAFRLPDPVRFHPLGRKSALIRAALPQHEALFAREKVGFVLPIEAWVRKSLASDVEAHLLDAPLVSRCGLNPIAVAELWRHYKAGTRGLYWSRPWAVYAWVRWCQNHQLFV